jgi:DNA repair ATPase RecN
MKIVVIKMSLAERDLHIIRIEEQIEATRKLLLEKNKKMNVLAKQNSFLVGVRDDYNKYYQYIIKQKQEQLNAMESLHQYLADLANSTDMTVNNIKDAVIEQEKVLKEMRKIKGNLNELVNE